MFRAGEETPIANLRAAIEGTVETYLQEVHTAAPGIVIEYDADTQQATIQLAIKRKARDGTAYTVPPLLKVPVLFPRTAAASLHWNLAADDPVLVLFCERNLDRYREAGGLVDPADIARRHSYTDAVALAGFYPDSAPQTFDTTSDKEGFCIQTPDAKIVIGSDGLVRVGKVGAAPDEPVVLGTQLLDYLTALHTAIEAIVQALQTGPVGVGNLGAPVPTDPTLAATLATQLTAIQNARTTYVDTASSNVVSQRTFVDRGT